MITPNSLFELTKWRTGGNDIGVTLAFLMADDFLFMVSHRGGYKLVGDIGSVEGAKGAR